MPLVDLILSFTKKHSTVYNVFIGTWLELREIKDVEFNLNKLYECLEYEQVKQVDHKCLEYFIDNEMAHSIYKIGDVVSKQSVIDFLVKLVSILPSEYFPRFNGFFDLLFSSKQSEELAIALIYSERAIVFGHKTNNSLVEYTLRFFFEEGSSGEYARACIVYLLCSRETFEYLRMIGFIEIVAQRINRIYLDLEKDVSFYLSLLQFVSYYAKKETDLYKKALKEDSCGDIDVSSVEDGGHKAEKCIRITSSEEKEGILMSYNVEQRKGRYRMHLARSPLLQRREGGSTGDQSYVVFDLIKLPYKHPVGIYKEILENIGSSYLKAAVINSVMENIENTEEHLRFMRECIENVPHLVAPYFFKRKRGDWSPIDVFQRVIKMKGDRSSIKVPRVCHVNRHRASVVDFLLENRICDDLIFLFVWVVSKETFYSNFDQISAIFKDHKSFWGDLWGLILE